VRCSTLTGPRAAPIPNRMSDESQPAAGPERVDEAEPRDAVHISLPEFDGPLDLLLHLVQKHELDILKLPIAFVAERYFEYIRQMEELSIDIASEYLVMAATLVHIKSRLLLPPDPSQAEEEELLEEEEDPRAELIRRLLEYQKYKQAAGDLGERDVLGRDVFARGAATESMDGLAPLAPVSLFRLVDAFEAVLQRLKHVEEHKVDFEQLSISEKIADITERLRVSRSLRFDELFEKDESRAEMIVTFLALLEMTKARLTLLRQEGPLEPIIVELAAPDLGARNKTDRGNG
jgi:segregation and condensation protein A